MPRARAAPPLQELRGARSDRRGADAPVHSQYSGDPPEWLSTEACRVWWRIVPELKRFSLLNTVEVDALVTYCEAVIVHELACREVAENGVTIVGGMGGLIKNPACTVMKESAMTIRAFAHEFGLTPATRSLVKAPTDASAETADDFFAAHGG